MEQRLPRKELSVLIDICADKPLGILLMIASYHDQMQLGS